jgi:hypothetical protein
MDAAILLRLKEAAAVLNASLEYREMLETNGHPASSALMVESSTKALLASRRLLWAVEDLLKVAGVAS